MYLIGGIEIAFFHFEIKTQIRKKFLFTFQLKYEKQKAILSLQNTFIKT